MPIVIALIAGLLFGAGLIVSGMAVFSAIERKR